MILLARKPLSKENNIFNLYHNRVESISCDVTNRDQVIQVCKQIESNYGQIDFIICSAGLSRQNELEKLPAKEIDQQISVNLTGVVNTLHATLPGLKITGSGKKSRL